jgi:hypothetical protein
MFLIAFYRRSAIPSFTFSKKWASVFGKLAILLLILFSSSQVKAATCTYKNFSLGSRCGISVSMRL